MSIKSAKIQPAGLGMTPSTTEFGSFIRTRRLALGIRQVQLAKEAKVSQSEISLLEIGNRSLLNDRQLGLLAKALQCSIEELRKRMPVKQIATPRSELGKVIRSRREELGMSSSALAKKMKVSRTRSSLLEHGLNGSIYHRTAVRLATALDLNISVFSKYIEKSEAVGDLGKLIRTRREELGMSGESLAKELGVGRNYICQIETGKIRLSNGGRAIIRLAEILKLDADKLNALRPARKVQKPESRTPLGKLLIKRRSELHLSLKEAAERAGITSSLLSSVELGTYKLSAKLATKLATALEFEIPAELIAQRKKRERRT